MPKNNRMNNKKKPSVACHRCEIIKSSHSPNTVYPVNDATLECEICHKNFCNSCHIIHDKHNECFVHNETACFYCGGPGWYDYGVKKVLCVYCL